jgi:hypothetical protein
MRSGWHRIAHTSTFSSLLPASKRFPATGTVLDQPFEAELPVPSPVPPEKIGELQAVLTPLGATVTGPPPFDPS